MKHCIHRSCLLSVFRRAALWSVLALSATALQAGQYIEAEAYRADSLLDGKIELRTDDSSASGGAYMKVVTVYENMESNAATTNSFTDTTSGQLLYDFQVPSTTNVSIWVRHLTYSNGEDSFYCKTDGKSIWTRAPTYMVTRWAWKRVATHTNLAAGSYVFRFGRREAGLKLDALFIGLGDEYPSQVAGNTPGIYIEAESYLHDSAFSPLSVLSSTNASGGKYVAWNTSGSVNTNTSAGATGRAKYGFGLIETSTVDVWARLKCNSTANDQLYVRLDGGTFNSFTAATNAGWQWQKLATYTNVAPGARFVELLRQEDGVEIDRLYICRDASIPYARTQLIQAENYENSALLSPLTAQAEAAASCGGFVSNSGTTSANTTAEDGDAGQISYSVTLGKTGAWKIYARVRQPSASADLFFWKLAGFNSWQSVSGTASAWTWKLLSSDTIPAGDYTLTLLRGEDGVAFDALFFTDEDATPPAVTTSGLASGAFYVAPAPVGNDSNSGSATAPWATAAKAASTLTAGQTVYFRGGTYAISGPVRPLNSGSESSRITYAGYPGESAVFDSSVNWKLINTDTFDLTYAGSRYNRFQNLTIRDGGRGFNLFQNNEVIGCRILNMWHAAIWVGSGSRVVSNYVEGVSQSEANEGIDCGGTDIEVAYNEISYHWKEGIDVIWGCRRVKVHHNYIHHGRDMYNDGRSEYSFGSGIYVDAAAEESDIEVYENRIFGCNGGISLNAEEYSGVADDLYNVIVRNNLIVDGASTAISANNNGAGGGLTKNILILNNTIVGPACASNYPVALGISLGKNVDNVITRNNLIVGMNRNIITNLPATQLTVDNNLAVSSFTFNNPEVQDYGLPAGSAAINAGHTDPLYNDPDGTRNDIGAYYRAQTATVREIDVRFAEPWTFQPAIASGDTTPSATEGTDFGSINTAYGSLTRTFAIRNAGGAALIVSGVTLSGSHPADFTLGGTTSGTILPGGSLQMTVTFDPSANGLRSATVSIASDDGNENPYTFAVQGTGITSPAEIDVSCNGTSIADGTTAVSTAAGTDFGSLSLNNSTASRTFVLRNEGGTNLTGIAASLLGANAADFSITTAPATSLSGGQTNSLMIQFDPSAGGIRLATVRIASSDADENPYEFAVSGHGIAGAYIQTSSNGLICFEAEGLHRSTEGTLSLQGVRWLPYEDVTASGQIQMLVPSGVTPDSFVTSPAMEYDLKFITGGTHYIWVRTHAAASTNGADDSIYVALDNTQIGDSFVTCGQLSWGWNKFNTSFSPSVGTHTLKVCHREDGVVIDKVVITTSSSYNPANVNGGLGPNASPTEAANDDPPQISAQPQNQVVTAGSTAIFTVTVSGTAPLSYQWKKNGVNTGANADTLSLNNVTTNDAGNYLVVVSNLYGAVTSSVATLTVNPPPPYTVLVEEHFTDLAGTGSTGVTSWPKGTLTNGLAYGELIVVGSALTAASTYGNSATFDGTGCADSTLWFSVLVRNTVSQDRLLFFSTDSSSGVGVDFTATQARADISGTMASTAVTITSANTNFIVGKLVLSSSGNETVTIWVNPTNFTSEAAMTNSATGSSSLTTNGTLIIATNSPIYPRMQGPATVFDEIRLSTELTGVTPTAGSQSPPDPYDTWAQSYNLVQDKNGDDDNDGTSNFLEYALRGNPTNAVSAAQIEFKAAGTNGFEYIYARRITANSGLSYWLEISTNLISGVWTNSGYTTLPATALDADFELLTNRISTAGGTGKFIRLRIEKE
jgi:hypothetical protein